MAGRLIRMEGRLFLVVIFGWRYTTRLKQALKKKKTQSRFSRKQYGLSYEGDQSHWIYFTELELGPTNPLPFSGGQVQQQRRMTNDGRVCVSMLMSQPLTIK